MVKALVIPFILMQLCFLSIGATAVRSGDVAFVGAAACAECHPKESEQFQNHSKKARSFSSIQRLADKLTDEERHTCYSCHTTGYGKPGGFVSETQTPRLKSLGCETCHGPGSLHIESEDPADLAEVAIDTCMTCHNEERVAAFKFKPMLYGGGH